jgi:leucyl aminopeptidase
MNFLMESACILTIGCQNTHLIIYISSKNMDFIAKSGQASKQRTTCLVLGIHTGRKLTPPAKDADDVSGGHISHLLRRGDLEGSIGQSLILYDVPGIMADRIILIGCGKAGSLSLEHYQRIVTHTIQTLNEKGPMDVTCYLPQLDIKGHNNTFAVRYFVENAHLALYHFSPYKTLEKTTSRRPLKRVTLMVPSRAHIKKAEQAIAEGNALGEGMCRARDLGNTPPNICHPTYMGEQAQRLDAAHKKITTDVFGEAELEKMGLKALLVVGRGSEQETKLVAIHYNGAPKTEAPTVLVGKGVTFDTGGNNLKAMGPMLSMKLDMCGAATVFATIEAVAKLDLPINLVALLSCAENSPGGKAYRPSDVIDTLSGIKVEVRNTDAEGRLVLCDALTYAKRYNPKAVIDVATLTGAVITSLGHHLTALFSNQNSLTSHLKAAANDSGDGVWHMPLTDAYKDQIKSDFADIINCGRQGDAPTILAACFLSTFTDSYPWAHLDIAGTGMKNEYATGRGVPLLVQYLINQSG